MNSLFPRSGFSKMETKTVHHPCDSNIPWPILWVLSRYSRKHIMISNKLPDLGSYHNDVTQFINRMKWNMGSPKQNRGKASEKPKRYPIPMCTQPVGPALECWLNHVANAVIGAIRIARNMHRFNRGFSNMNGITILGLKMLRKSNWVAVPNDKDSGYTLEEMNDVIAIHGDILKKKEYKEIPICGLQIHKMKSVEDVRKLLNKLRSKHKDLGC